MAIYVVGDIQGCFSPLEFLLAEVKFNPAKDKLWCCGDIINRGPRSLDTIRFLYQLGDACTMVLGNHDLHTLAVAAGITTAKPSDTIKEIIDAPDSKELLRWLRYQPLIHHAEGYTMVHAGIPPQWTLEQTISYAREVEAALRGDKYKKFLKKMYGNFPDQWDENLTGRKRLRLITNYLTRMRFVYADGRLDLSNKLGPDHANEDTMPWFHVPGRKTENEKILFGHWASLEGQCSVKNVYPLDTGCVWGGRLTMMRLHDQAIFSCCSDSRL